MTIFNVSPGNGGWKLLLRPYGSYNSMFNRTFSA